MKKKETEIVEPYEVHNFPFVEIIEDKHPFWSHGQVNHP